MRSPVINTHTHTLHILCERIVYLAKPHTRRFHRVPWRCRWRPRPHRRRTAANLIRLRFAERNNYPRKHHLSPTDNSRTHGHVSGYLTRRHACFRSIMPMLYRSLPVSDGPYYPGGMSSFPYAVRSRQTMHARYRPAGPERVRGFWMLLAHELGCALHACVIRPG